MEKNKYTSLVNNSLILAVGNIGSKLITFLMVPLYTRVLTESEFGTVDYSLTIISLLLPIISLNVFEAVVRFILKKQSNSAEVISNSLFIAALSCLFFSVFGFSVFFILKNKLIIFIIFITIANVFQNIIAQYTRGSGFIKEYAINGIITTFTLVVMNVLLLVIFNFKIEGYLFSTLFSILVSIVYLLVKSDILIKVNFKFVSLDEMKQILLYSLPLIPHSIMWWVINAASRTFVVFYLSASANGLFAVASKIPTILNVIYSIFMQAWQISAFEEYDSEDKAIFYSNIFEYLSTALIIVASSVLLFIRPLIVILASENFFESWKLVPFLLLATVFLSFSSFYGTIYTASMKTNRVLISSFFGGLCTILISWYFIPRVGLIAAAFSNCLGFFIMWLIMIFDTKSLIKIKLSKNFFIGLALLLLQVTLILGLKVSRSFYFIQSSLLVMILYVYKDNIKFIFNKLIKRQ